MVEIDNIIFDIDGTLIDSRDDIVNAINYALSELGLQERPFDDIISYVGRGLEYLVEKSLGGKNNNDFDKVKDVFVNYYLSHCVDKSILFPSVKKILKYYKDKRKFVITNRIKESAEVVLDEFKIRNHFEDVIGGDKQCIKPSVCIFEKLITRNTNIDRKKTIIIGDMDSDIIMGKDSGIKTCWVTYGLGKDVINLNPNFVIDNLLELKNIIK